MEQVYIDGDDILNGFGEVIGKVSNPKKPRLANLSVAKGVTPQNKKPLMSTASVRAGKANAAGAKKVARNTVQIRPSVKKKRMEFLQEKGTRTEARSAQAGRRETVLGRRRPSSSDAGQGTRTGTRRRASAGDTVYMNARAEMFDTMDDFCLGQATQEQSVAKFKAALTARCNRNR